MEIKFWEKIYPFSTPIYLWNMRKLKNLTENDLNRLVTKIIQEQKTEINQEGKKRFDKLSNDVLKGFCVPVFSQGSRMNIKCQDGHHWILDEYRQFGK